MKMRLLLAMLCIAPSLTAFSGANQRASPKDFTLPKYIKFPKETPYNPQVAMLGKMLFFDPRLSSEQNIACVTCHNPSFGWENPEPRTVGALNTELMRHTPSIANLFEAPHFFRDGSARTLEDQARDALTHPHFMGAKMPDIVARLNRIKTYKNWFKNAFPNEGLTEHNILRAIATYERTIVTGPTPFDDWANGNEYAISISAKRGFEIFVDKGKCSQCHTGWAFTDHKFHDIGLPTNDIGRAKMEPNNESALHAFKTSGLRNIAMRAPYMHNGSLSSLRDVVSHYRSGGVRRDSKAKQLDSIKLSPGDIDDLISFLSTLSESEPHVSAPALPAQ